MLYRYVQNSKERILHNCIPHNVPSSLHHIGEVTYHFKTKRTGLFQRLHPAYTQETLRFIVKQLKISSHKLQSN